MMRAAWWRRLVVVTATMGACVYPISLNASDGDARCARFSAEAIAWQHRLRIPGVAVGVFDDRRLLYVRGDGYATIGGPAVTGRTLFPIASLTKTIAAVRLFQLVEARRR